MTEGEDSKKWPQFPNLSLLGVRRFRDCEWRQHNVHAVNKIRAGGPVWHLCRPGS